MVPLTRPANLAAVWVVSFDLIDRIKSEEGPKMVTLLSFFLSR